MENVTLSKDQKLITITSEKYSEYEDWRRKAENNTVTLRKIESYRGMRLGGDGNYYSVSECESIETAISSLQWIVDRNKEIVEENNKLVKSIFEGVDKFNNMKRDLDIRTSHYNEEIQKVPKFIRKWFNVNI